MSFRIFSSVVSGSIIALAAGVAGAEEISSAGDTSSAADVSPAADASRVELAADATFPAVTSTARLTVAPSRGSGLCPGYFDVVETGRLYEGGVEWRAVAYLQWMADPFVQASSADGIVTWTAPLKAKYARCRGTARITSVNGDGPEGSVHLRAVFGQGKVTFVLDVRPYGENVAIMGTGITVNNPSYRWAVAD